MNLSIEIRVVQQINKLLDEYKNGSLTSREKSDIARTMRNLVNTLPNDSLFKQGLNTDIENAINTYQNS